MEFAVIKTGGKQYVVAPGDVVTIEKLGRGANTQDLKKGDPLTFSDVLLVDNGKDTTIGTPTISGASVVGTVQVVGRAKKVEVVKYKAKSRYLKRRGHRQPHIKVKIDKIV
ncbi:MAG TPA: 50S ribosomal protein L21 [Candidatus Paceibacterota bacterium]|jgi:large subunit ribosomal protein L21